MEDAEQSPGNPRAHEAPATLAANSNPALNPFQLETETILPNQPDLHNFQVTDTYGEIIPSPNLNFSQQISDLDDGTIHNPYADNITPYDDTINPFLILQDAGVPQTSNQGVGYWELPEAHNLQQVSWYDPRSNNLLMNGQNIATFDALAGMPYYGNNQPLQPGMMPEMMEEQFCCGLQQPQALEGLRPPAEAQHDVETLLYPQITPDNLPVADMASLQSQKFHQNSLCPFEYSNDARMTSDYTALQRDGYTQFNPGEFPGLSMFGSITDAFLAADTSTEFERTSKTENSIQHGEVSAHTELATGVGKLRKNFGPSRPVSLPPPRRGGRKGPLTVEEKTIRKRTRQQGACIRCRQTKKTCSGGIPCMACREKSKAPRWKYPCVKAHFYDMVENAPFFPSVSKFERSAVYTMTPTSLALQFCSMAFQSQKEHFTRITTGMPGPFGLPGVIIWPAACEILMGVLERTNKSDCGKTVLRHMSDVIRLRAKSNKCPPPILFMLQPPQGSLKAWITRNTLFCTMRNIHEPSQRISAPESDSFPFEYVFETLAWVTRRYFEISLFLYLQKAANRLASVSRKELSEIAANFLQVLIAGLSDTLDPDYLQLDRDSDEGRRIEVIYTEQTRQVRLAISCYLRSALDKLDPWSDFWAEQEASFTLITPKALKNALSNLDDFDTKAKETWTTVKARLAEWKEWQSDPSSPCERCDEKCDFPEFDMVECREFLEMAMENPPWKIEIYQMLESFEEHYEPKLKLAEEVLGDLPGGRDLLDPLINGMQEHQRTLTHELEVLENVTGSTEGGKSPSEAKVFIRKAVDFMNELDMFLEALTEVWRHLNACENDQAREDST
ncbi:hypothetical protein BJY01DRAFT_214971 [Aspergillus pseudoustus]|uniref:Zn(2)-C6 fungal-type domain-containing protein n=1 Tax=Aspergillus pseudoustus TaxID=1810923 RepID=A0ABR4JWC0_9EURO